MKRREASTNGLSESAIILTAGFFGYIPVAAGSPRREPEGD
ncbi:hypothetical protein [Methanocalculus taiwanensis]|nr:hypothetical protein [Methanocalculus taiwanensis]